MKRRGSVLVALWMCGQFVLAQAPPELGQGWMSEYNLAARQLVALAEAIPEEKFKWRPGPGVRSTSEVLMHIAYGNYWMLDQAGGKIPDDTPDIPPDLEKQVTAKVEVIRWLSNSLRAVKGAYPHTNRNKTVKFLGRPQRRTQSSSEFLFTITNTWAKSSRTPG